MKICQLILALGLCGCAFAQPPVDSGEMYIKASALTKVTTAVQAFVRYEQAVGALSLSESDILLKATEHDPQLLTPFNGFKLRVLSKNRNAAVLMCNAAESQALLEDVGCTAKLDRHHWQATSVVPCDFVLNIDELCTPAPE